MATQQNTRPQSGESKSWWCLSGDEVLKELQSHSGTGLTDEAVLEKRNQCGSNRLPEQKKSSAIKLFLAQFSNLIIWVLAGAAAIAGFLGEWMDTAAILVIVVLNGILGFVQEYRAEKALTALKNLSNPVTRVIRAGHEREVASHEIVPGDILLLEAGDRIPADGRVISAAQLKTEEAALTGESLPVVKTGKTLDGEKISLGDRKNMVYMGTAVVNGKGRVVVTATALGTELGKIASMLQTDETERTPLQERLENLGRRLVGIFLGVVAIVFAIGVFRGNPLGEMLLTALSLAVAAIPEGLPAVVTISLAVGVHKMAKRNALIRRLPSVETLGCANVICSDKTGTLTQNKMTVRGLWLDGRSFEVTGTGYAAEGEFKEDGRAVDIENEKQLAEALRIGVLCNGASLKSEDEGGGILGDPTEAALLVAGAKAGLIKEQLENENSLSAELPFDSERKRMSILRETSSGPRLFVKGAPDVLLEHATRFLNKNGEAVPLSETLKESVRAANLHYATGALRVLAVAYRDFEAAPSEKIDAETLENDLTFAGLVAMMDPPREEVKEAMRLCKKAGIRSVMITGDHKETAVAIARELGMADDAAQALDGSELDQMTDDQLEKRVKDISVYARVSAEHKLRVVRAWRKTGAVVAMTGDGVNDAPAVKEADIGVAMGITGTDVTKEASDMVVTDDNFTSIVSAVEEGRGIYDNIVKFVKFLLAFNLAEILVLLVGIIIGFTGPDGSVIIPLSALQILWLNLVSDGLPAIALGVDPLDHDAMSRPPREARGSIFTRAFVKDLAVISFFTAAGTLFACYWGAKISAEMAQTMTLTTLVTLELAGVQIVRSKYHVGLLSNHWLVLALAASLLMQLALIYVPFLRSVFGLAVPGAAEWAVILLSAGAAWGLARFFSRK